MKNILTVLLCFVSISCFASTNKDTPLPNSSSGHFSTCGHATPISDPRFCASFKAVAYCNCTQHGMPPMACHDMDRIRKMMIVIYGSLWNACSAAVQVDVPQQECADDWSYYATHC
jgi:hypothetical protein